MKTADINKIDTNLGRISLRRSPASVQILDESKIPNLYKTTEVIHKVDKARIKKELQNGKHIDGTELVENKYNLAIK